ncbi:MAG: winged helix-turn-helix domain-containing protein [Casimicrobiaceae bacterium]
MLLIDGEPSKLGVRAVDLPLILAQRRDRIVSKSELLELAWPGLVVEENNVEVQISALRKVLGAQAIATIAGRGYRLALAADNDAVAGGSSPAGALAQARPGNLPLQLTSFVGREAELRVIGEQLRGTRLLTLTGAGGSGKTRLAVEAAAAAGTFPNGTWFVELAPVADAALLPDAVAHALGVTAGSGKSYEDMVVEFLGPKHLLLVIDNCEHLVEACASLTHRLLVQCPKVRILATSREAMRVPGEVTFAVSPLAAPDPMSFGVLPASLEAASATESVRLFVDRARSVRPPTSRSRRPTHPPWPRSAFVSMASRWRSNSPRHARRRWGRRRSCPGSTIASGC